MRAVSKYMAFHGEAPRSITKRKFNMPEQLVFLGEAIEVVYKSDKINGGGRGRVAYYKHKFSKGTKLYSDERGRKQLYIIGSKLYVNDRGIVN